MTFQRCLVALALSSAVMTGRSCRRPKRLQPRRRAARWSRVASHALQHDILKSDDGSNRYPQLFKVIRIICSFLKLFEDTVGLATVTCRSPATHGLRPGYDAWRISYVCPTIFTTFCVATTDVGILRWLIACCNLRPTDFGLLRLQSAWNRTRCSLSFAPCRRWGPEPSGALWRPGSNAWATLQEADWNRKEVQSTSKPSKLARHNDVFFSLWQQFESAMVPCPRFDLQLMWINLCPCREAMNPILEILLVALSLGVGTANSVSCLRDAIPAAERINITMDGVSMPLGIWQNAWDS